MDLRGGGAVRALTKKVVHDLPLKKKVVDDILGGAAAWETAERTSSTSNASFDLFALSVFLFGFVHACLYSCRVREMRPS